MAELSVEISAKIDKLLSELGKAKKALGGIGKAAERLTDKLKRVGEKMNRIGKSMATYLTLPLLAIGGAAIKMSSDFTESLNKVDVAFKSSSKEVREFAKTTLETFGIAEGTALDMAALFGDMATSMGVPVNKAANLSTAMVGLAGDLSSFKNINIKEVTTALNGVFTGETESLKRLGIVMTQTNLKQFALSKGMSGNIETMTQAQKVQLRYAFILEKTKNAQGDFARTSDGSANQMRIFSESVKELTVAFGKILLPFFTKAVTYINKLVKSFTSLDTGVKKTVVVIAILTAAIGPLLVVLGFLMTSVIPLLITGMSGLISAFQTLYLTMLYNPITAVVAAIGLLVGVFFLWNKETDKAIEKQNTLTDVNNKAIKSISSEKAKLAELLFIAKSDNIQKSARLKAVKKLNELSPKFLGNLTLEKINTDDARIAVELYNKELLKTARIKAAQSKLQELQSKIIDLQIKSENASIKSAKKLSQLKKDAVTLEDRLKIKAMERQGYGNVTTDIYSIQVDKLKEQEKQLLKIIGANQTLNSVVGEGGRKKAATIDTTGLMQGVSTGEEDTLTITPRINTSQFAIDAANMKLKLQEFNASASDIIENSIKGTFAGIGHAIGEAMVNGGNLAQGLGQALLGGIGGMLKQLGKMAIGVGVGIKAIKEAFKTLNPAVAIGAGIALIALGSVFSAGASKIGSSGSSGGGSSSTGSSSFRGSSGGNFGASGGGSGNFDKVVFEIQGTKLVGVLSNTLSRNRSLGGSLGLIG